MGFSISRRFTETTPATNTRGADPSNAAIMELSLWAAIADGELSNDDINDLLVGAQQIPGFERFTANDLATLIERNSKECATGDAVEARVKSLTHSITNPQVQRLTYQIMITFAAKDGELSEQEDGLLSFVQQSWGISDDEAQRLADAVLGA
ncbi:TerB family tellurite resistance protein [Polyangium sp. 6x1]|uniref:TerB family tellurite resistance protein n=1 Tax=Polyangium sp. 6x1 TaxID=3042689 RepID=UPI002482B6D6|nr:TerB family tellurite resistance protein [Polyangium sp. 6x1]MDI1451065.1 TerB family tellurite resistance protein [Polyangium sp. 6x1]